MVAASLAASRRGARLIELAKRDIWSPQRTAQERPDVVYSLLAVDFLPVAVLQRSLRAVAARVAAGMCSPLCSIGHSLGRAAAGFRLMMQAWWFYLHSIQQGLKILSSIWDPESPVVVLESIEQIDVPLQRTDIPSLLTKRLQINVLSVLLTPMQPLIWRLPQPSTAALRTTCTSFGYHP